MIERLALLLLIGGCLMFGAIIFIELEPAGADDAAVAKVAARRDTAPTMRLQQNAAPSAERVHRSRGRFRSRRYEADRDCHRARSTYRDLRRQRRQTIEG